ncbi:hypothetical protein ABZ829_33540 [Streptomyces xanthochromogenes]|uniref:hypothetical protein n=1 Tax=Streptomyces xanthochromogenes TaxID=67384 RepID=UPI0034411361
MDTFRGTGGVPSELPELSRRVMQVLDLWDEGNERGEHSLGRPGRMAAVIRMLHRDWLAPLGVRLESVDSDGSQGPGARLPRFVLHHEQVRRLRQLVAVRICEAVRPVDATRLLVLGECGYVEVWDALAAVRGELTAPTSSYPAG